MHPILLTNVMHIDMFTADKKYKLSVVSIHYELLDTMYLS